jgi:hypothetical protein
VEALPRVIEVETSRLAPVDTPEPAGGAERELMRLAGRLILALVRRRLTRELAAHAGQGLSHVPPAALEGFARETLVGLVTEGIRWRVNVAHVALWTVSAVLVAGPIA